MRVLVYVPVLASVLVVLVVRGPIHRVAPRAATLVAVGCSLVLAAIGGGALLLLSFPLAARISSLAAEGRWRTGDIAGAVPVPEAVSVFAVGVLVFVALRCTGCLHRLWAERAEIGRMHRAINSISAEEIVVVDSEIPAAYALTATRTDRARIVLTTPMTVLLDGDELAAIVAHERAHLALHHRRLIVLTDVAIAANPLLTPLRSHVAYGVERWADEQAAATVGRTATRTALQRSALAHLTSAAAKPCVALGSGDVHVAARVRALTQPVIERRWPVTVALAVTMFAITALGWCAHDMEHIFEMLQMSYRPT